MKVRVTILGKFPKSRDFTLNEYKGEYFIDEITEIQGEVMDNLERVMKGRMLGFCVQQVSKDD